MTKEDFWSYKIKAFLSTLPVVPLLPANEEQTKEFIAESLGPEENEINLDSLKADRAIAKGFDIPPFIESVFFSNEQFLQNPLFKHPLSGEEIKFDSDFSQIDKTRINRLINDSIIQIRTEINDLKAGNNLSEEEFHQRLFLALWRKLPDVIRQKEIDTGDIKIGKYWDWLPADPRIPTHSVWDHASICSAIAGTNFDPALLIFTIASPQAFISTARRTQDSWMGSFLYSFLMWEAIKSIADRFGPDCFLFPDLRRQPLVDTWLEEKKKIAVRFRHEKSAFQIANFPNMLTAILPFEKAAEAAAEAREAMKQKWEEIAEIIQEKIEFALKNHLEVANTANWKNIWKRQIDGFLDQNVFWVACPWQDGEKNVLEVYRRLFSDEGKGKERIDVLEKLLNTVQSGEQNAGMTYQGVSAIAARALIARKNLRDFDNRNKEEGEKCSLCGMREAFHPDSKSPHPARYSEQRDFWRRLGRIDRFEIKDSNLKTDGEKAKFAGRIKRGDALCAVCLVKRLALNFYFNEKRDNGFKFNRHLFPSTSAIATAPLKAKIIEWCALNAVNLEPLEKFNRKVAAFLDKINLNHPTAAVPKLENKLSEFNDRNRAIIEKFLRLDGQWLIKNSFYSIENRLEKPFSDFPQAEKLRDEAVAELEKLLKEFSKDFPSAKSSGYYAVISMDGDKIGDWLSGAKAPSVASLLHPIIADGIKDDPTLKAIIEKNRPLGAISHLSLSIALKNFALEVAPQIIEKENYGKLIYAGGDDLLAFVPTENLLKVTDQLHRFFQGKKSAADGENFVAGNGIVRLKPDSAPERDILVAGGDSESDGRLTASIGAAIIHHSYPLPQAIEEAFAEAMKKNAKDKLGRNAVAFHLLKRAGSPLAVGFKFDDAGGSENIFSLLQKLLKFIKKGDLSARIAYAMHERSAGLNGSWTDLPDDPTKSVWWHEAQIRTLRYLVSRQAKEPVKAEIGDALTLLLKILYRSYRQPIDEAKMNERRKVIEELADKQTETGWETLTELLFLLKFLAGEEGNEN